VTEAIQRDVEAVVATAPWSASRVLAVLGLSESSYYRRKRRTAWQHGGGRHPVPSATVTAIVNTARRHPEYGYRQVHAALQWECPGVSVAPITVYRVLNRHGLVGPRTSRKPPQGRRPWVRFERAHPHELWQTDVSYWYIEGWGYYYLHTVLDDHSRYIITSRLYRTYGAEDGVHMLGTALAAVPESQRPNLELLADHGVTYTADRFGQACAEAGIKLVFGSVAHPQTKGKIERWHRTIREAIEERVRYAPTPAEAQRMIDAYVEHYNQYRPHSACQGYPPIWRYDRDQAQKILAVAIPTKSQAL
jgi:putative transposase